MSNKCRRVTGYAHRDTCKRGKWGWYYPIICDRKKFMKMIKGLGKGSEKYWRKVTLTTERITDV